jgi:hypothetical protein
VALTRSQGPPLARILADDVDHQIADEPLRTNPLAGSLMLVAFLGGAWLAAVALGTLAVAWLAALARPAPS